MQVISTSFTAFKVYINESSLKYGLLKNLTKMLLLCQKHDKVMNIKAFKPVFRYASVLMGEEK